MAASDVMELGPRTYDERRLGLCLSGGGLRAALFHLGFAERLYELGVLEQVRYLSTVSGGSILGAWLALRWGQLLAAPATERAATFEREVTRPILACAQADLRNRALRRALVPKGWGKSGAERLASVLDDVLFHGATLGELPPESLLSVSLNATNLRNGKRFRFSRDVAGDYLSGYTTTGVRETPLSMAAAASAAFPGAFGPLVLKLEGPFHRWTHDEPPTRVDIPTPDGGLVALMDGGIYENLGIQAASYSCGRIIAVDAGLPLNVEHPVSSGLGSSLMRAVDVMMSRIVGLPASQFVEQLVSGERQGVFARLSRSVEDECSVKAGSVPALPSAGRAALPRADALRLALLRTDLDEFSPLECELLRFHGKTMADAALCRFQPSWIQAAAPIPPRELTDGDRALLDKGSERRIAPLFAFWRGF